MENYKNTINFLKITKTPFNQKEVKICPRKHNVCRRVASHFSCCYGIMVCSVTVSTMKKYFLFWADMPIAL